MGNRASTLGDLNLFSKGGVFTSEQLDEYQVSSFTAPLPYHHYTQNHLPGLYLLHGEEFNRLVIFPFYRQF